MVFKNHIILFRWSVMCSRHCY